MKNNNDLIQVSDKDAKVLTDTIVEVEACQELYQKALNEGNYPQHLFKGILEQYMNALKEHKYKWRETLKKYVEEDDLLYYRDLYLFDIFKKVIFLPENIGE